MAKAKFGKCECGCGKSLIGPNRQFLQGHDMKLKSRIKKMLRADNARDRRRGAELLEQYGWRGQVHVPDKPADAR